MSGRLGRQYGCNSLLPVDACLGHHRKMTLTSLRLGRSNHARMLKHTAAALLVS